MIGTKLNHYEITSHLGTGGMGEVYQASDSKLGRSVAIKLLPEAFTHDADRAARFEREARVLASLNHPNIASIHGLEESGGRKFLVMELVPGETLAERISRGATPIDEAVGIAKQMTEALEAAHERGIIHRDLKPANVKITPDGKVKVLDFGLAKAFEAETANVNLSNSPTLSMAATNAGVILGTAAYMSPEQAKAKANIDKRADIWAFGVVFYELITGKRLFQGDDLSEVLAAVIMKEPALDAAPPQFRRMLNRCLEKDPKKRLRDIGDVWELAEIPVEAAPPGRPSSKLPWAVAAVLVLALAGLWIATRPTEPELQPLVRMEVDLGADVSLGSTYGPRAIISPKGDRLVYISSGRLFTRRLSDVKATELAGTLGAVAPFFSPNGEWVAFYAPGQLKKVSIGGGTPVPLTSAGANPGGGAWGEDGNIIASFSFPGPLMKVPETGGAPTPLTALAAGERRHGWPQILPGGKAVLFTTSSGSGREDGNNIAVVSLVDKSRKDLVRGAFFARYSPSGHLLYFSRDTLFAVRFDPERLEMKGAPVPVIDGIDVASFSSSAHFDLSASGTAIYRTGGPGSGLTVQWMDATGAVEPILTTPGVVYRRPRLSRDGQYLAVNEVDGSDMDIWTFDFRRKTPNRLTFKGSDSPLWTPDGRFILFKSDTGISWVRSDGGQTPQPLVNANNNTGSVYPYSFTPDGKRLSYFESTGGTYDLWTVAIENDGTGLKAAKPEAFLQTPVDERHPAFSPDGRWIAYSSAESGTFQIYVRAFPDKGGKWQIPNGAGVYPNWSRDGKELFFRTDDNQVMVTSYNVTGDSFSAAPARAWSERRLANIGTIANYDVAPDGKRILAILPAAAETGAETASHHVTFLENFFDELRRLAPPQK